MVNTQTKVLGVLRISLGLVFLWAFFDKLLGLGFASSAERAWIMGGSPTYGFLTNAIKGPLLGFYQWLANYSAITDVLFMVGLLGIGMGLTLGIANKLSSYSGALLMLLMWSALLLPENNPFIDDHIIYALTLILLYKLEAGKVLGLGAIWEKSAIVKKFNFLK